MVGSQIEKCFFSSFLLSNFKKCYYFKNDSVSHRAYVKSTHYNFPWPEDYKQDWVWLVPCFLAEHTRNTFPSSVVSVSYNMESMKFLFPYPLSNIMQWSHDICLWKPTCTLPLCLKRPKGNGGTKNLLSLFMNPVFGLWPKSVVICANIHE